jgi:hypothetical protein
VTALIGSIKSHLAGGFPNGVDAPMVGISLVIRESFDGPHGNPLTS